MNPKIRAAVRLRARDRCEYCDADASWFAYPMSSDHIIAIKHQQNDSLDNLAWACFYCNCAKGPNIAGIDPKTGNLSRLFNPRTDSWDEHFMRLGCHIEGRTAVGRTTVHVLDMNHPLQVMLREAAGYS